MEVTILKEDKVLYTFIHTHTNTNMHVYSMWRWKVLVWSLWHIVGAKACLLRQMGLRGSLFLNFNCNLDQRARSPREGDAKPDNLLEEPYTGSQDSRHFTGHEPLLLLSSCSHQSSISKEGFTPKWKFSHLPTSISQNCRVKLFSLQTISEIHLGQVCFSLVATEIFSL